MPLVRQSPCKINLILNILGPRPDGYHELETILQPVPLYDELSFERTGGGIVLTCDLPELPVDSSNLVHRAAIAFLQRAAINDGVRIHLSKRIPLAAGLGGGSANAAISLAGLNELFGRPLTPEQLTRLAEQLGSDVPFFLQANPALAGGRGERVMSLAPFAALNGAFLILVRPGFGISTAWAYQGLQRFPAALNGTSGRAARLAGLLRKENLRLAAAEFYNSLEAPVFDKYPWLAVLQDFLRTHGAETALMSGSGSTTFALVSDRTVAEQLIERIKAKFGEQNWVALVRF